MQRQHVTCSEDIKDRTQRKTNIKLLISIKHRSFFSFPCSIWERLRFAVYTGLLAPVRSPGTSMRKATCRYIRPSLAQPVASVPVAAAAAAAAAPALRAV
jgi:hypothetical protein